MNTVAAGQLGAHWSDDKLPERQISESLEAGHRVQIQALDEDSAQKAAQILQDRHDRVRKPMKTAGRKLVCTEDTQSEASEERRLAHFSQKLTKVLLTRLPIITWMSRLEWKAFRADIIAGVTVGVMAIP